MNTAFFNSLDLFIFNKIVTRITKILQQHIEILQLFCYNIKMCGVAAFFAAAAAGIII